MSERLPNRAWWRPLAFTGGLLLLVGLAARGKDPGFIFVLFPVALVTAALFWLLVPEKPVVAVALTNSLAIYAVLFVMIGEANFTQVSRPVIYLGFVLPIAAFLLGVWRRRAWLKATIAEARTEPVADLGRLLRWLVPLLSIGIASFVVPRLGLAQDQENLLFLTKMGLIALVVMVAERDVVAFQLDLALLFDVLFDRLGRLAIPIFAFLTIYSLMVIVFACLYRIVDMIAAGPAFASNGQPYDLGFGDALYFSVITLATIGYGDIVPVEPLARVLASVQAVMGMLLLLFGFSEIMRAGSARGDKRDGG
jgi:voltage-gated potassium channel